MGQEDGVSYTESVKNKSKSYDLKLHIYHSRSQQRKCHIQKIDM